jgi:hypothetical protein
MLLQPLNIGISKGSLTPRTTGTNNSRSLGGPVANTSAQVVIGRAPRLTLTRELKGAVLYHWMDVDRQVEEKWKANVRSHTDELVGGVVRNELCHEQETMYAAIVQPWPFGTAEKRPSIVVSVPDSKDRKAVKTLLKQHQWLKDEVKNCGLRLMVVEDHARLQSKGRLADLAPATSLYKATLNLGSTAQS